MSSQDKYTKDYLSVDDDEYDVERIIKNLQTVSKNWTWTKMISLIKIQLKNHMGSYEEKDFIRTWVA